MATKPQIASLVVLAIVSNAAGRTWTDVSGKFSLEAELLEFDGSMVRLKKTDGSVVSVPLEKLGPADRQFVQLQSSKAGTKQGDRSEVSSSIAKHVQQVPHSDDSQILQQYGTTVVRLHGLLVKEYGPTRAIRGVARLIAAASSARLSEKRLLSLIDAVLGSDDVKELEMLTAIDSLSGTIELAMLMGFRGDLPGPGAKDLRRDEGPWEGLLAIDIELRIRAARSSVGRQMGAESGHDT